MSVLGSRGESGGCTAKSFGQRRLTKQATPAEPILSFFGIFYLGIFYFLFPYIFTSKFLLPSSLILPYFSSLQNGMQAEVHIVIGLSIRT
jgi:hypothetical protein